MAWFVMVACVKYTKPIIVTIRAIKIVCDIGPNFIDDANATVF